MKHTMESISNQLSRILTELGEIKQMMKQLAKPQTSSKVELESDTLSTSEALGLLNIDRNDLYTKCASGEIPAWRIGKMYKFKRSDLLEWKRAQEIVGQVDTDDVVQKYLQQNQLRG